MVIQSKIPQSIFRTLVFLLLCISIASCANKEQYKVKPIAESGYLDLTEWNFKTDGIIPLKGDWEIYWNKLLVPEDFKKTNFSESGEYMEVPGFWNHKSFDGETATAKGFATFRLRVSFGDSIQNLMFRTVQGCTAQKTWINGVLIASGGTLSKTEDRSVPYIGYEEFVLSVEPGIHEIIIQISNFEYREGGIRTAMLAGKPDQLTNMVKRELGLDYMVLTALFILGLFLIWLFIYNPGEWATLFLAIVCFSSALHVSVWNELVVMNFFNDVTWGTTMRLGHMANYIRISFLVAFINLFFPREMPRIFSKAMLIWGGLCCLIVLFTNTIFFTALFVQFEYVAIISLLFMTVSLILALIRRRKGAVFASIGLGVLILSGFNDLLHNALIIQTGLFFPVGLVIAVMFLTFTVSDKIMRLYESVKMLSQRLVSLDKIKNAFIANTSRYNLEIPFKAILENVEADKGFIYIREDSQWILKMFLSLGKSKSLIPLECVNDFSDPGLNQKTFPYGLIKRAITEKRNTFYDYSKEEPGIERDPYFIMYGVKSAFCMRIESQESLIGILFIESQNTKSLVNKEKLELLDLLSPQLTTLLDNIEIFRQLEDLNKHLEQKVAERTAELNLQNQVLEVAQKKISESIQYASHIQTSVLLREEDIQEQLPDCFIYNQPRDVVSGDFCWFNKQGDRVVIAAIDCTGHGVPGAFMCMIGNILLNDIVIDKKIYKPSDILKRLNQGIAETLRQGKSKTHAQDGMDIAICTIDYSSNSLQFAGAKNPLYLIRKNQLGIIKADPRSIGGRIRRPEDSEEIEFTNHEMSIEKGINVYLFSDGYLDQFGGEKGEKFGTARFNELLTRISDKSMEEQKREVGLTMEKWMKDQRQTDDMLIIGFPL